MTERQIDTILEGILEWYADDEKGENVYFEDYLTKNTNLGRSEWDMLKQGFTDKQKRLWDRVEFFYKSRLEQLGVSSKGSSNFIREKLKQEGFWKANVKDELEENQWEMLLNRIAKKIKKEHPMKRLIDMQDEGKIFEGKETV